MTPLFDSLDAIAGRLRSAPRVWVGTDFDGTLARYTDDPAETTLTPDAQQALAAVAARFPTAVVSGRDIPNLKEQVGLPGLGYAGNHGLEIELPGERFEHPAAVACRPDLRRLAGELMARMAELSGAWVQDKGLSLTVHYRRTPPLLHPAVGEAVLDAVGDQPFRVRPGVLNWEVRPPVDWHKGSAVGWLRERQVGADALGLFLGDDHTDEDAFAALPDGITVLVGENRESKATYHAADPATVTRFLWWLAAV